MPRPRRFNTLDELITEADRVHGGKYTYANFSTLKVMEKGKITCPSHGDFEQSMNKHLTGQGCPQCTGKIKLTTEEFVARAMAVHGDRYDYSQSSYVGNKKNLVIVCREHGQFEQSPVGHILQKQGCPKCGGKLKRTIGKFVSDARGVHGDRYEYDKVEYVNDKTNVTITCKLHGDFKQLPSHHIHKAAGCKLCTVTGGYSKYWFRKNPKDKAVPGKLYFVEFSGKGESFYKIGITRYDVGTRFKPFSRIGLTVRTIATFDMRLYDAFMFEQQLIAEIKAVCETPVNINIGGGESECFIASQDQLQHFLRMAELHQQKL